MSGDIVSPKAPDKDEEIYMGIFDEAVARLGDEASAKLKGPGQREALIRTPIDSFFKVCGEALGLQVQPHDEVTEMEGLARPDYAINVNGAITGHVEVKAPGVSLDPKSYGKTTHNYRQWQKLRELPNLIYTNGIEWRLWRSGELVGNPVHMVGAANLEKAKGKLRPGLGFDSLITDFLRWQPVPITTVTRLVETVAPLTRLIKEQVRHELTEERRRVNAGEPAAGQLFLGLRSDWRNLLFPRATDEEFSDGYAQTITFALLLAQVEGVNIKTEGLHQIGKKLHESHSLMGRALQLLTDQLDAKFLTSIDLLIRVISVADWAKISKGKSDVYLHLYEHFFEEYDFDARKKTGSYYTPVEVVDGMVRLTEHVLSEFLGYEKKFRDPRVHVMDPAMGTGTYPLSIMRNVAEQASLETGPGSSPEELTNLMSRLYGFELQSGPFSVAEMRITGILREAGAKLPKDGLQLFVTNTLSDPELQQTNLGSALQLIAQQSQRANHVKRESNVQVVIGNPPYKDNAGGMGEWVENGNTDRSTRSLMDDFKEPGHGVYERKAKNLYAYFWRWAMWKVFESTANPKDELSDSGIICFITAEGYLTGAGFAGMRRYIRQHASHGWIIDLTPEGKRPPQQNAIFSIETPVGIGVFVRKPGTDNSSPAHVQFMSLTGTAEQKYEALSSVTLDSPEWLPVRSGWTDSFTPKAEGAWDDWPAMHDLFGWWQQGIVAARTWVYGPHAEVLQARWRTLALESDLDAKKQLFVENRDTYLAKGQDYLPGVQTEVDPTKPFTEELGLTEPPIERVAYRSFDRQWIIADKRVVHNPRPTFWAARVDGQVFVSEGHTQKARRGPALTFTHFVPDIDHFRGSEAGRVLPFYHANGEPNLVEGLVGALSKALDAPVSPEDVLAYIAGVASHPGFIEQFAEELATPGIRVPFTSDALLWNNIINIGRRVLWLHTYGQTFHGSDRGANVLDVKNERTPVYAKAVSALPQSVSYDEANQVLHVGESGEWHNVSQAVYEYEVGGKRIVDMWFKYRLAVPITRGSSGLNKIVQQQWPAEWSKELSELLTVLTELVELEPEQEHLLSSVAAGPLLSKKDLINLGARWPTKKAKPKSSTAPGEGKLPL